MICKLLFPTGNIATVAMEEDFKILPNFTVREIANNKAKEEVKLEIITLRAWKLLKMLQNTRNHFGKMNLSSCYRTKSFNSTLENASVNSAHLRAWAFDVLRSSPNKESSAWIDWWGRSCELEGEIGAIGLYNWGFHCEIGSDVLYNAKAFKVRDYR